jgi:hypothetical protein
MEGKRQILLEHQQVSRMALIMTTPGSMPHREKQFASKVLNLDRVLLNLDRVLNDKLIHTACIKFSGVANTHSGR